MRFGPVLFWSLLAPLIAVLLPYLYALAVMWSDPGSSLESRGLPVLMVVAVLACAAEVIAVPLAFFTLWREPAYRTAGNLLLSLAGFVPLAIGLLLYVSVMYGHR